MKNAKRAFTLIELLIVVTIIAIIASIAIPNLMAARLEANENSALTILRRMPDPNSQDLTQFGISGVFVSDWMDDRSLVETRDGYQFQSCMITEMDTLEAVDGVSPSTVRVTVYAYPVRYGNSGNRAFIRFSDGTIYQSVDAQYSGNNFPGVVFDSLSCERGTWQKIE